MASDQANEAWPAAAAAEAAWRADMTKKRAARDALDMIEAGTSTLGPEHFGIETMPNKDLQWPMADLRGRWEPAFNSGRPIEAIDRFMNAVSTEFTKRRNAGTL